MNAIVVLELSTKETVIGEFVKAYSDGSKRIRDPKVARYTNEGLYFFNYCQFSNDRELDFNVDHIICTANAHAEIASLYMQKPEMDVDFGKLNVQWNPGNTTVN